MSAPARRRGSWCVWTLLLILASFTLIDTPVAHAQPPAPQYRGFWVDTYNTRLSTPADVAAVITRARDAGANALFVQVRRRGDAWYLQTTTEPLPEGVTIDANFDPLAEVIAQAHAVALEVHAFVVVGAVWSGTTFPVDPRHVFNVHGMTPIGPIAGPANWLTRVRPFEGAAPTAAEYRFGTDYWLDFGHPDAAAYVTDIITQLVAGYELDGLHLDRIQYPDPTPSTNTPAPPNTLFNDAAQTAGYNEVSLGRFRKQLNLPSTYVPVSNDPAWSDWRRAQITALMRRIYFNAIALKPHLKVSAGVAATGPAPLDEAGWLGSEPYARLFQDWRGWLEQGLLDLAIPLNFRAEHQPPNAEAYAGWLAWTRGHQYGRFAAMGLGAYLNALEGTIRQARLAMDAPGVEGSLKGVVIYSLGAHNAPVSSNPFALPSQRDTPLRPFEDVAAGLRTGRTTGGQTVDARNGSAALFAQPAPPPAMPWKVTPTTGYISGTVTGRDGAPLDGVVISIESDQPAQQLLPLPPGADGVTTDASGFFALANLAPGAYRLFVQPLGEGRTRSACSITVGAGGITTIGLSSDPGQLAISLCAVATPAGGRR